MEGFLLAGQSMARNGAPTDSLRVLLAISNRRGIVPFSVKRRCEGRICAIMSDTRKALGYLALERRPLGGVRAERQPGHQGERALMAGIDITPDAQGKVRDLYDLGDRLLLVATDRISAFDYILEDEIPYKGQVLTQLSKFWFDLLDGVVENHLISTDVADLPEEFQPYADYLRGRFMLVKKADMFPAECIVRRVSGWQRPEGVQPRGHRLRHRAAPRPRELLEAARAPSSPPPPRPRLATTTRTSPSSALRKSSGKRMPRPCATWR